MTKTTWLAVSHFYTLNCPKVRSEITLSKCRSCGHWKSGSKDGVECDYEPNKPEPKGDLVSKPEALIKLRINHDLLTEKLVYLRELEEKLHRTVDAALESHMEVEAYLIIQEKAKE